MISIIVAFSKIENAKNVKNILVRSGHPVLALCSTGAQTISQADTLNGGILICGYRFPDMVFSQLRENLPDGFEILLMASESLLEECAGSGVVGLAMPLKVHELVDTVDMMVQNMERRRRCQRAAPRKKNERERAVIEEAKALLIQRNHMTEEEAHRYIQKCSMDSGTNLVETAQMVLAVMRR